MRSKEKAQYFKYSKNDHTSKSFDLIALPMQMPSAKALACDEGLPGVFREQGNKHKPDLVHAGKT